MTNNFNQPSSSSNTFDGQTVKVDFNPSSSNSSYQDTKICLKKKDKKLKICYLF